MALLGLLTLLLSGCGVPALTTGAAPKLTTLSSAPTASHLPSTLPPNVARDFAVATTLQGNGNCAKAIPLLLHVIQESGSVPFVKGYFNLGACYEAIGSPTAAIVEYDNAIALDPTNFYYYLVRANPEFNSGYSGQAIADCLYALRLATHVADSYRSIAQTLDRFADFADAITAMDMAIRLAPQESGLYEERGNFYRDAKEYAQAFQDYQRAIHVAPFLLARANIYSDLAGVYDGINNFPSAYGAIAHAIRLRPAYEPYYIQSGDIHQHGGDFAVAVALYDRAARLAMARTDREQAVERKGDAYGSLGQLAQAVAQYRAAEALTKDPGILRTLRAKIKSDEAVRL